MTIEEQFAKWWDESGKLALIADQPTKTIAFQAYKAAVETAFTIEAVGHQFGFKTGNGTLIWRQEHYWNGCRPTESRALFVLNPPLGKGHAES